MLRRAHLIAGIAAIIAFLLSGQLLGHHHPSMEQLSPEMRMMYVSRHIYLLAGALVNAVLGLYLHLQAATWRRALQVIGSIPILTSVLFVNYGLPHGAATWHGRTRLAKSCWYGCSIRWRHDASRCKHRRAPN